MANYTKATNFASKDSLLTGNPSKLIRGTEIDTEFNAISTAITTKADTISPTFTGTPLAPTAGAGNNSTQIATTAFVTTNFPTTNIAFTGDNTHAGMETFRDNKFEVTDNSDTTKKLNLELSGITTGTTRTLTVPDKSGTISLTSDLAAVSSLSTQNNSIVTGNYSVSGSTTATITATHAFSVGQEVFITFTNTSGSAITAGRFTIVTVTGTTAFTVTLGSSVTSGGTVRVERYGLMAFANSTEMTAGTSQLKAVSPKLYFDSTIGVGQTWQDVTGSRVNGTSYQNTTGRPIMMFVSMDGGSSTSTMSIQVSTDNSTWLTIGRLKSQNQDDLNGDGSSWIIPNNLYYRTTGSGYIILWTELR